MKSQDPLTGTGPRFFRPDYAAAFFKGVFTDEKAKEATVLFKKSGLLYLTAKMPPWMRLKLGGGALTPTSKEQLPVGGDPGACPVKAGDFDGTMTLQLQPSDLLTPRCRVRHLLFDAGPFR